jgi:hypothetical protein
LWAKHACLSMFAFCVQRFHMSESATAKRIWAARTARRFPVILQMMADGELHLSGIAQLAKHLTVDNHRGILTRAKHKSAREIERLVAELAPRADLPSRVRALPRAVRPDAAVLGTSRSQEEASRGVSAIEGNAGAGDAQSRGVQSNVAQSNVTQSSAAQNALDEKSATWPMRRPVPQRKQLVALAPRRYKLAISRS